MACFLGTVLGSLVGLGMMKMIIPLFLVLQYCFALPFALYYGMSQGKGVIAFYTAQAFYQALLVIGAMIILCRLDWHDAKEKLKKQHSFDSG